MNTIPCVSCGQDNQPNQVYCTHCGVILSKAPKQDGIQPLPTSVAVAARRVQRVKGECEERPSMISRIWGFVRFCVCIAFCVGAVLALMDPKIPQPDSPSIANAAVILQHNIANSREVQVSIAQSVINQALSQSGKIEWVQPYDFIPVPQWVNSSVFLTNGEVRFNVTLTFLSHPLFFSETFRLSGTTHHWSLSAESASIGLLEIRGPVLAVVTPFMKACVSPFASELMLIKEGDIVRIRPGFLDLSSRP